MRRFRSGLGVRCLTVILVAGALALSTPVLAGTWNAIADGGFELGSPNPFWTRYDSWGAGQTIVNLPSSARSGSWLARLGCANCGAGSAYVAQQMTLGDLGATLEFWVVVNVRGNSSDRLLVLFDGMAVAEVSASDPLFQTSYRKVTVVLPPYTQAGEHEIKLVAEISSTGLGSIFYVDDVRLDTSDTNIDFFADFSWSPENPVDGDPVQFTDTSVGDITGWRWDFGDGQESEDQHPVHVFASPGDYDVSLTVIRADSITSTEVKTVEIGERPHADFSWTPPTPRPGEAVRFSDQSTSGATFWRWDFGDGATSVDRNPSHSYAEAGSYSVFLQVGYPDLADAATSRQTVHVMDDYTADFTWSPERPKIRETVDFLDQSSSSAIAWAWDFGDGATGTGRSPSHAYDQAGVYRVELTTTFRPPGATDTFTRTVEHALTVVSEALAPAFDWLPEQPRAGDAVQFADHSRGEVAWWRWDLGDGATSTDQNPSHIYRAAGRFTVILTIGNLDVQEGVSTSREVVVNAPLQASFRWQPGDPVAQAPIQFADQSTGTPMSWDWSFGDGGSTVLRHPRHVYEEPGDYDVRLRVTAADGQTSELLRTVYVSRPLEAHLDVEPELPAVGETIRFTDRSRGAPIAWRWDLGDGTTSALQNDDHAFAAPGSYLVRLEVRDAAGNVATTSRAVLVGGDSRVDFAWTPTAPEAGRPLRFENRSSVVLGERRWLFGDGGASSLDNPLHVYGQPGLYLATMVGTTLDGGSRRRDKLVEVGTPSVRPDLAISSRDPAIGEEVGLRIVGVTVVDGARWIFGGPGCGGVAEERECAGAECLQATFRFATWGLKNVSVLVTVDGELYGPLVQQLHVRPEGSCGEVPVANFGWWPLQPKVGETVRFTDRCSGPPREWSWDFGDGAESVEQHPGHVFTAPGSYQVSVVGRNGLGDSEPMVQTVQVSPGAPSCGDLSCDDFESYWSCPWDCPLGDGETARAGREHRRLAVPAAVGGVAGANGTFWVTEGTLFNPNPTSANVVAQLVTDDGGSHWAGPFRIPGRRAIGFGNLVEDLFDLSGSGSLFLDADLPLMVDTRTFNSSDEATYGQGIGGVTPHAQLAAGDDPAYLLGLAFSAGFRTNLLLQETTGEPITVRVRVFDTGGGLIGEKDGIQVPGRRKLQRSLQQLGMPRFERGYATLEVTSGDGRLAAIASVVDAVTGDATTVDLVHPLQVAGPAKAGEEEHSLVAVVARTPGAGGSLWRSELSVLNPAEADADVRLEYRATGGAVHEAAVTVAPGDMLFVDDVIAELFQGAANGAGALHLYSSDGVIINSRTYNVTSDGASLGQAIPGLGAGDMALPGEVWVLDRLKNTDAFRCNLGFSEYTGAEARVTVALYSMAGSQQRFLGSKTYAVPAYGVTQVNRVFNDIGITGDYEEALAYVIVSSGEGAAYVYASVVDNGAGDATTVLAKRMGD